MEAYPIAIVLISLSALFSGLTLGYFTLNLQTLRRQAKLGNSEAIKIVPIREQGNQLLTTLLLGNVAVNAVLSVFLSSIASGVIAAFSATVLIFLFGEIIPQAVLSRHAMKVGALCAPLVRILMIITSPITYPIALVLDRILGAEMPSMYSPHEIMEIISEHEDSEHSPIDADEERIVHGALRFSHLHVREIMTPAADVISFDEHQKLNDALYEEINDEGYSRFPTYKGKPENITGILFAKDLIVEDDNIAIAETEEALERDFLRVRGGDKLDTVLGRMLKKKKHIAIVYNRKKQFIGVVSLEDIIEEIIQVEIEDEDDADDD